MTDQPTGRALAEAAARAMGWKKLQGSETWDDGTYLRTMDQRPVDEREMLAWLTAKPGSVYMEEHPKAHRATFVPHTAPTIPVEWSATMFVDKRDHAEGPTLRDALMRLVVVVAEREAANG